VRSLTISRRIKNILIGFDQFVWVLITFGAVYPDETISSATYRYEKEGHWVAKIARPVIDALFYLIIRQKQHCRRAYLAEVFRRQIFEGQRKDGGER